MRSAFAMSTRLALGALALHRATLSTARAAATASANEASSVSVSRSNECGHCGGAEQRRRRGDGTAVATAIKAACPALRLTQSQQAYEPSPASNHNTHHLCAVTCTAAAALLCARQPAGCGCRRHTTPAGRRGPPRHQDATPAGGRPPGAVRRPRLGGAGGAGGSRQGGGGGAHCGGPRAGDAWLRAWPAVDGLGSRLVGIPPLWWYPQQHRNNPHHAV